MSSQRSIILGISFGHGDSSAALIVNGQLVAAAEEERFNRIKHYALFPTESVRYCLTHAGVQPEEVTTLAIPKQAWHRFLFQPQAYSALYQKAKNKLTGYSKSPSSSSLQQSFSSWVGVMGLKNARLYKAEHHLAHLMTARCLQYSEPMALMSIDGLGDLVSTTFAVSDGPKVKILDRIYFPHSLGFFYTAMTHYLGFPYYGDEFKVMGLSSYGTPRYLPALRDLVREGDGLSFHLNLEAFPVTKRPIHFRIDQGQPYIDPFYNTAFLTQRLGLNPRNPKRQSIESQHRDLAKSVQIRFEEIADHLLQMLHAKTGLKTLGLSGGCAHNSVWVGKIARHTPFQKIFVAPACHDAGTAAGAAMAAAGAEITVEGGHWGLLGPTAEECKNSNPSVGPNKAIFEDVRKLQNWMAERLAHGEIIGLVEGRLEFGPRALGSRSILADPRHPGMRDRLNQRVKHRETFRPFAASVLAEYQDNWFNHAFHSPHMEAVFDVKTSVKDQIAAVVHADGTCRIQSVEKNLQPFYWGLIESFRRLTGVPMLINTSFNDSEPIVASEKDALECFKKSDLDHLVVEKTVYSKSESKVLGSTTEVALNSSLTAW